MTVSQSMNRYFFINSGVVVVPGRDVVSRWDGDALPPGPVPAAVRVPGEDALPATVAIATAVGQRQALDLHRRANIQVPLRKKDSQPVLLSLGLKIAQTEI